MSGEIAAGATDAAIKTIEEYLARQAEREAAEAASQGGGSALERAGTARPAEIPASDEPWIYKKGKELVKQAGQTAVGGAVIDIAEKEWGKTKKQLKKHVTDEVARIGDHFRSRAAQHAYDRVDHLLHGHPGGIGLNEQQMRDRARRDPLIHNQPSRRPGSIAEDIMGPSTPTRPPPAVAPPVSTPTTPPPTRPPPPPPSSRPPPMSPIAEGSAEPSSSVPYTPPPSTPLPPSTLPTPATPSFVSPSMKPNTVQASNYYAPQFAGSGPALSLGQPVPFHSNGFARRPSKGSARKSRSRKSTKKTRKRVSD